MARWLRTFMPVLSGLAVAALAGPTAFAAASPAQDPVLIGPGQYFTATINGASTTPVIEVVCPGPLTPGQAGHPVAGQYVDVQLASGSSTSPVGYTGSAANSIDVLFDAASGTSGLVLKAFYAPVEIPTSLELPCGGAAPVTFTPAPTSSTAKGLTLTVTYEDIAA